MGNAARIDDIWDDACIASEARRPMEANRWFNPVVPTEKVMARSKTVRDEIDFHGVIISWKRNSHEDFPEPVMNALLSLESFMTLAPNWDSYGGQPMSQAAVRPAVNLILLGNSWASYPRLVPLGDGGVGVRWKRGELALEIDVAGDGSIEGILENGDDTIEELPDGATDAHVRAIVELFHTTQ